MSINRSLVIFLRFLQRDFHEYRKQIKHFLVNYGVLRPLFFSFSFAYIQANVVFQTQQTKFVTVFLIGNTMMILLVLSFTLAYPLLFDFEQERFIDYQISMLDPKLVILERIVFSSLFCFVVMLPFFPVAKLILQSSFDSSHSSWPQAFLILYLGSLCCCAYHFLAVCIMKGSGSIISLWMRVNIPLLILGGLLVPLHVIQKLSPLFSFIIYLNPIIYLTEGLRSAILGTPEFLPVSTCAAALLGFSVLFTLLTFYFFRKKTDHI